MSDTPQEKPKRRPRYKGTHPRRFEEKYKERAGDEKLAEKFAAKGKTLAGTHRPIMVNEILEALNPMPGKIIVDATLGYGGHSWAILEKLAHADESTGRLIAFDRDPIERVKTEARLREKLRTLFLSQLGFQTASPSNESHAQGNPIDETALEEAISRALVIIPKDFAQMEPALRELGLLGKIDGVLADLGLSSMQIDDPSRGFTFKVEGPLDLRMNPNEGEPASAVLKKISHEELTRLLEEESDEPRAKWCAKAILDRQKKQPIETTKDLADAVRGWLKTLGPSTQQREGDTPIRRAFQALRMRVNQEGLQLDQLLESMPRVLKSGATFVALSFHSGEDRRVKKSLQNGLRSGAYSHISEEAIRPTLDEQKSNTRSTSTKMRWGKRA